ncbi:Alpha/Beta hydrolase protein [Xylariales sp. AK1849]|nr:Alpha/Beta hydrolase protein [Xylariales sp. AK1849]
MPELKKVKTPSLEIAYYEHGEPTGWPVILSHGFPYDVHAFDEVVPHLISQRARVIVPYLRGYGPTRFLSPHTMRSGQQAALGADVISLLDALSIERAVLAGFDWGGMVSCVGAALWPERVAGLVCYAGYDVVDLVAQREAFDPAFESLMWYQHLLQSERGRKCMEQDKSKFCRLLWTQWSPNWSFSNDFYARTAASFDNADFVDVVTHAYRFIHGNATGDPELEHLEQRLATRPKIVVPSITLDGTQDPLKPGGSASHAGMFAARHERREFEVGHAFPSEAPRAFAKAILDVHQWSGQTTQDPLR